VRLGTYRLDAYDPAGRFRATASGVTLTADGQVETRALVFIGIGRVEGFVHNPFGAASSVSVEVRSLDPVFGRAFYTSTGAAGEYAVEGVPVGQVRVSAVKSTDNLRGENVGLLEVLNPVLTIHVTLENNTFTAVRWIYDANDSSYAMQPSGAAFAGGVRNIFAGGAAWLDLVRDGTRLPFDGTNYGTYEDGGRETVGRQIGLHGLNVTRKFFVPENGYFTRVLETLTNPTAADITVDVVVTSNMTPSGNQAGDATLQMTSSGDAVINLGAGDDRDRWLVTDDTGADADPYYATRSGVPVGFVFEGEGAARTASTVQVPGDRNQVEYRWDGVTVPAGGTVTLMHFVAQQVHRHGAIESATRIVQLPPEALAGLDPTEIESIVNFAVPSDGISTVDPLPAIDGQVSGAVFEGDGTTPVSSAAVSLRSRNPLFGRAWTVPPTPRAASRSRECRAGRFRSGISNSGPNTR
jgi:hypothetical protein